MATKFKKMEIHAVKAKGSIQSLHRTPEGADEAEARLLAPCDKCGGNAHYKAEDISRSIHLTQP